jgi:hypothetical protein
VCDDVSPILISYLSVIENLQKAAYRLIKIVKERNLIVSTNKIKVMVFKVKHPLR